MRQTEVAIAWWLTQRKLESFVLDPALTKRSWRVARQPRHSTRLQQLQPVG
jgi:hypothetical protein